MNLSQKAKHLINKLKGITRKKLFKNFMSLSILQGANYIFPLITLPYLVRVLKPDKYGLIAFAQSFIQYFIILTDYGFNLSATREISINRDDKNKVSEIFNSVMAVKICLLVLSGIILTILVLTVDRFNRDWSIYFLSFGMVVGQVLFPIWFFQGIEQMKYITIMNITAKSIFTLSIFLFVREQSSYVYVPLLNSLGFIVAGVWAFITATRKFSIKLKVPKTEQIIHQVKDGWHIFISTVAISLYTVSNTFILGLFAPNEVVGYYSAAEKLIRAITSLMSPVSRTIYPHISKLVNESKEKGLLFIKKTLFLIGGFSLSVSLMVLITSGIAVKIILGTQYAESAVVLKILSPLPFLIALSNIFGIQTMLTFNYKKAFSRILILASIINIALAFALVPKLQHIGISIAVLTSETFVSLSMLAFLKRKGINIFKGKLSRKFREI